MPTKLTIAICLFALTLVTKLAFDYHLWLSGKPNKHKLGPAIVLVVLVGCSFLSGWRAAPMYFFDWWAIWDTIFALLIGQPWSYVGETSQLDKWQRINPALLWLKYVGAIVSTGLFISWKVGLIK